MQVTDYECFEVPRRSLLLRVETDAGYVGWGEPILEGRARTAATAVSELMETYILGEDPFPIEDHWQRMYRSGFYRGGPILSSALSGIDQALWDIKGKALGVPIYELLGGAVRDRIKLYAHYGGETIEEEVASAVERVDEGFTALKSGPGINWEHLESPTAIDQAREKLGAVREAVGDEIDLMVDFHGRPSKALAKRLVVALEEFFPAFYEELLVPEKNHLLPEVAQRTSVPIATGERLFSRWDVRPVLESGAVDVIQPDVSHAGGITETRKIAELAATYDVAMAPHSPLNGVALAACLQVDACTHNAIVQEQVVLQSDAPAFVDRSAFEHDGNGFVELPSEPGLGIDVDEDLVRDMETTDTWETPVMRREDGSITEW